MRPLRGAFEYRGQVVGRGGERWPWWRGCCCVQPSSTSLPFPSQSLHVLLVLACSRILLVRSDGLSSSRMGWKVSRAASIDSVLLSISTRLPFRDTSSNEGCVEIPGVTSGLLTWGVETLNFSTRSAYERVCGSFLKQVFTLQLSRFRSLRLPKTVSFECHAPTLV